MSEPTEIYYEIHKHVRDDVWCVEEGCFESSEEASAYLPKLKKDKPSKNFRIVKYTLTSEIVKEIQ